MTTPYRPSNGTEGEAFEEQWCRGCAGYFGGHCTILQRVYRYDVDEPEYPRQWLRDDERPWGYCTSFVSRDDVSRAARNQTKPLAGQMTLF